MAEAFNEVCDCRSNILVSIASLCRVLCLFLNQLYYFNNIFLIVHEAFMNLVGFPHELLRQPKICVVALSNYPTEFIQESRRTNSIIFLLM